MVVPAQVSLPITSRITGQTSQTSQTGQPDNGSLPLDVWTARRCDVCAYPYRRKRTVMAQVLLVDDDPALRRLLHALLQGDGHMILEAADGVEALATLEGSMAPLIVLLDWQMPRLDGFGVLRAVAADPRLRALHRFVLVTAADWQQDHELTVVLEQLQVPVLPKPFDLAIVSQVVEQAVTCLAAA